MRCNNIFMLLNGRNVCDVTMYTDLIKKTMVGRTTAICSFTYKKVHIDVKELELL